MYNPTAIDGSWAHGPCPPLASNSVQLQVLKQKAAKAARSLVGKYSNRLRALDAKFSLHIDFTKIPESRLDAHYDIRHRIAHDQGLLAPDDPSIEPRVVLGNVVSITEADWKAMISDFLVAVAEVDRASKSSLIADHGIVLYVSQVVTETRTKGIGLRIGTIRQMISDRWKLSVSSKDIESALGALGIPILEPHEKLRRRIVK
ncbi:MAG TPA: hypothetical protein VF516_14675 [Kofleriaceae bacterium]